MERMIPPSINELLGGTASDDLDRIVIKVGKIGSNSVAQSLEILAALDTVSQKINALPPGVTRRALTTELESILSKLRKEAGQFIRDTGGMNQFRAEREKVQPSKEQDWWYLDQYLQEKRSAALRRMVVTGGIAVLVIAALAILYNRFLAPDPEVAARYGFEQSAQENLMYGSLTQAYDDVEKGLAIAPQDPTLLVLKGVILEASNQAEEAKKIFSVASQQVSPEDFRLLRGQAYIMANQLEKARVDSEEAIRLNPDTIQGYLLLGQVEETTGQFRDALDSYEKAYTNADKRKQYELAALARTRMAMLMQSMNTQITPPGWMQPETPTP